MISFNSIFVVFLLLGPFLIYGVLYISPLYLLILSVQSEDRTCLTVVNWYNKENTNMTS
jgi:hypothetical protein